MAPSLSALAVAAGCGALIGSIRQWSEQTRHVGAGEAPPADFSGVRTHTLWALLGALAASFAWALPVALLIVAAHLIALRWSPAADRAPGGTGFAAALLTVLVGALLTAGEPRAAVLVTAFTVVLLGLKQPIHEWTRRFTPADIRATLQFVAITGIVLPLVPDRPVDPWGLFNPYKIWLMVVLISGLGFAGYVAMRLLGARAGVTVTALLGGLASSTASTLAFARRSRVEPGLAAHHAFATVTACTVMLPRVALAIALFSPALALALAAPLALMAAPALGFAVWFWLRRPAAGELAAPAMGNPLGLATAIKFAALYAGVGALVKLAAAQGWQESGLLPLSFVSGLTDVDAISLNVAQSVRDGALELPLAVRAVALAAAANSLLKAGLAVALGGPGLRGRVALVLGATAALGAGWAWLA
jgi:uncharacterized membrane protein (DUF4010 family)